MRILIAYGTTHGHTARIAERIASRLREQGAEVVVTGRPAHARAAAFDAIIVGGRVHGSRYPWRVTRFIRRNLPVLTSRPGAFFSVSLLQLARDPVDRAQTNTLPDRVIPMLGWKPDQTAVIGGALAYKQQYGILAPLFKRMWRRALGDSIDPTLAEQIFTDWAQVDRFADSFLRFAMRGFRAASAPAAQPHL